MAEVKVELRRKWTQVKLKSIPFLKSLDASFFVRVAIFASVLYGIGLMLKQSKEFMVAVKEEGSSTPNKYSKTFG